jgi:hypothetical protein
MELQVYVLQPRKVQDFTIIQIPTSEHKFWEIYTSVGKPALFHRRGDGYITGGAEVRITLYE